ncbi:calcium/calmodulin-dependent protein kinase [Dactylonectria macrodidyma]|uniref:non-specific serine/threonine protein kinase n=1 Tax=Dactylonectria macrodidyma TaxID=307937 RepID=A0A9P9FSG2_9HYPO|nr:calcium/calmodulin-dependent protein kinase [Dactylonectria macrodidyma]
MPRDAPHPFALFSLVPLNERAFQVLDLPDNSHHVSSFWHEDEHLRGLDVGIHIGSKSRYTLATIGRMGDILVEGSSISRIQCSFEISEINQKEIMLHDRSTNKSTYFFGETAMSFENRHPHRRVVVDNKVNLEFGFGRDAGDLYQFRIVWHGHLKHTPGLEYREDNPRQTRTVLDAPPTVAPSHPVTRIHPPGGLGTIRYSERGKLGNGAFGEVWKAVNVDSGEYLAVKRLKRPILQSRQYVLLKREVESLTGISHRNIIVYRATQWAANDEYLEIFMDVKSGNVLHLIRAGHFTKEPSSVKPFLHQMLQALDYLVSKSIIHRDVKPENILYTSLQEGAYLYQLADFGLANIVGDAQSRVGTGPYMAPELEHSSSLPQTPKMDVWSLFVTLAYAVNGAGFQKKPLHTTALLIQAVQDAANDVVLKPFRDMAIVNPSQRATAGDMLDKIFAGKGRTTEKVARKLVKPAEEVPPEEAVATVRGEESEARK